MLGPFSVLKKKVFGNFHETNIYYFMYPMFNFYKLTGFNPLSSRINNQHVSFRINKVLLVVFISAFILHCVGFAHTVEALLKKGFGKENSKISYFASWTQVFSLFAMGAFDTLSSWRNSQKLMSVVNSIQQIDTELLRLKINISYRKERKQGFIQFGVLMLIPVFVSMVNCLVITNVFKKLSPCYLFICFIPIFFVTFREFQFFNIMFIIKSKSEEINKKLLVMFSELVEKIENTWCSGCKVNIIYFEKHTDCKLNEKFSVVADSLWRLSKISSMVHESLDQVMEIFSGHLVLLTAVSFSAMTVQGYNLFALIMSTITMNYYNIVVTIVWLGVQMCCVWVNVVVCNETLNVVSTNCFNYKQSTVNSS